MVMDKKFEVQKVVGAAEIVTGREFLNGSITVADGRYSQ
jgi:hypothetical protein